MQTQDNYNKLDGLNNSSMNYLLRSPAHYKVWRDNNNASNHSQNRTGALALGVAIHCLVLEPELFKKQYKAMPDMDHLASGKKAVVTKALNQEAESLGVTLLTHEDFQLVHTVSRAVMNHPIMKKLDVHYLVEHSMQWLDKDTGSLCKGRCDIVDFKGRRVLDIKTTMDASPKGFLQSVYKYNLHRQAAFYVDGIKETCGVIDADYAPNNEWSFLWIAVEKIPPYGVAVYEASHEMIQAGREEYKKCCKIYADCMSSGIWPGYTTNTTTLYFGKKNNKVDVDTDNSPW